MAIVLAFQICILLMCFTASFSSGPQLYESWHEFPIDYKDVSSLDTKWRHGQIWRPSMSELSVYRDSSAQGGGGGHSHMSVNIKSLSIAPPPFLRRPFTPNDLLFHPQSTPNDPFLPLSYQILHTICQFSSALRAF